MNAKILISNTINFPLWNSGHGQQHRPEDSSLFEDGNNSIMPKVLYSMNYIGGPGLKTTVDQGDRLLSDPKKYFVREVYFCQKKYISNPERSTNCAKSLFSDKIIDELPHF